MTLPRPIPSALRRLRSRTPGPAAAALGVVLVVVLIGAGCSSDDDADTAGSASSSTTLPADPQETAETPETADSEAESDMPEADISVPEVKGPIDPAVGNGAIVPQPAVALPDGYVEEEFFVGGEASMFSPTDPTAARSADGQWAVEPADQADYRTRVLVRRPAAAGFSGTVVVEWLNVTATEASPDWGYLSEEIGRAGHAYVAVSAQSLGVMGGEGILSVEVDPAEVQEGQAEADNSGLVNIDPERYGTLIHPGDGYAYDMYSQVGAALAANAGSILEDLEPAQVIAIGESQSAGFLTTYVNAVHPLTRVYDGFLVHSRGAGGAPLGGGFGAGDEGDSFVSEGHQIRTDLDEPVFMVQAETDLTVLGYHLARQPDTDRIRTWEMAGTAHADAHVIRAMIGGPRDPGVGSFLSCENPINAGPHHEVVQAALAHLVAWTAGGEAPPAGERLELVEPAEASATIARDELGRAIGGVRNPLVDVPIAIYTGDPWDEVSLDSAEAAAEFDVCDLFGQTFELDRAALRELHGSADEYVAAFNEATDAAVEAGFLLPADADELRAEAEEYRALFG